MIQYFVYGKNNDRYQKKKNLLKYIIKKTLLITKVLYLGYQLLFLFDNITSYLLFALNAFQVNEINKNSRSQQKFF